MFSDLEADDNRRPDILIRNPYGSGNQIIVDAAVVGFNGSTRTHNNKPQQVVISREKQKISKYGTVATDNGLVFLAAVCFLLLAKWARVSKISSSNKLDLNYN